MTRSFSVSQAEPGRSDLDQGDRLPPRFRILLVEDNPADVDLIRESFSETETEVRLTVAPTGEHALAVLTRREVDPENGPDCPHLILLDLNLPGMHGHQVLTEIKENSQIRHIPIVILSSSDAESDISGSYALGASCYLAKPLDYDAYRRVVRGIEQFWLGLARLPGGWSDGERSERGLQ